MGDIDDLILFCDSLSAQLYHELRDRTGRSPQDDYMDVELSRLATKHARRD